MTKRACVIMSCVVITVPAWTKDCDMDTETWTHRHGHRHGHTDMDTDMDTDMHTHASCTEPTRMDTFMCMETRMHVHAC